MGEVAIVRFLESKHTGEYYAEPGRWVDDIKEAKKFSSLSEATRMVGTIEVPWGCCVVIDSALEQESATGVEAGSFRVREVTRRDHFDAGGILW